MLHVENIEGEPFNSRSIHDEISKSGDEYNKIKEIIQRKLSGEMEGIKHNLADFMDYTNRVPDKKWGQSEIDLHKGIIDFFGRVILNGRKNLLKRMVSAIISSRTDIWNVSDFDERDKLKSEFGRFKVSISKVREDIERLERMWKDTKKYIEYNHIPYYQVDYEDFFENKNLKERVDRVREIVDWLGFEFTEERIDEVREVLDPKRKLNNEDTYRNLILNVEELNRELGPEFGYLF